MIVTLNALSPQAWFERGYEMVMGVPASQFRFIPGETPFSTINEVVAVMITYLIVIFGGQMVMKNHKPYKLTLLFQLHNLFLTGLSLGLFLLFVENVLPIVYHQGFYNAYCEPDNFTQRLELLYYINYLTKYYELLDTVFLVLRKKNLQFLHWYHHSMTALLCYTQLNGRTTVSWVPVTLNLAVHVLMYYYYFLATFKSNIWWKKSITVSQIIQFILDMSVIAFCYYNHIIFSFSLDLPHYGDCHAEFSVSLFGSCLLASYLYLFLDFFQRVYKKSPPRHTQPESQKITGFTQDLSQNTIEGKPSEPQHDITSTQSQVDGEKKDNSRK